MRVADHYLEEVKFVEINKSPALYIPCYLYLLERRIEFPSPKDIHVNDRFLIARNFPIPFQNLGTISYYLLTDPYSRYTQNIKYSGGLAFLTVP